MSSVPSKRLYLRDLPKNVGEDALLKYLSSYGKILEVKIVHNYAFVQFDSEKDAQDVLETFQHQPFLGKDIIVEFARPLRKNVPSVASSSIPDTFTRIRPRLAPAHVQPRYPVIVTNIPRKIRWQELKDFGRKSGGLVAYCDLDKKKRGQGFIEYFSMEDAERAIRELNDSCLGGKRVQVSGRPETFVRTHSRSRSPECRAYAHRSWLSHGDTNHRHAASYTSGSDSRNLNYHEVPPPAYENHRSPASYYHLQHSPPRYRSPVDQSLNPHSYQPAAYQIEAYNGDQYLSHMDMEVWKYDYDYDFGHALDRYNILCGEQGRAARTEQQTIDSHYPY